MKKLKSGSFKRNVFHNITLNHSRLDGFRYKKIVHCDYGQEIGRLLLLGKKLFKKKCCS